MPLPSYVANSSYSIKYTSGDSYAYKTHRKELHNEKGIGKGKRFMVVFTKLTEAEYTTEISDNWS